MVNAESCRSGRKNMSKHSHGRRISTSGTDGNTTTPSRNRSSQVMCGSSGLKTSEGDEFWEKCLDLLEDLMYDAISADETAFNPDQYLISAEIYNRVVKMLDACESSRKLPDSAPLSAPMEDIPEVGAYVSLGLVRELARLARGDR